MCSQITPYEHDAHQASHHDNPKCTVNACSKLVPDNALIHDPTAARAAGRTDEQWATTRNFSLTVQFYFDLLAPEPSMGSRTFQEARRIFDASSVWRVQARELCRRARRAARITFGHDVARLQHTLYTHGSIHEKEHRQWKKPTPGFPPDGWPGEFAAAPARPSKNPIRVFLKTTILGGLLFLIPLVLTILLLREAIRFVGKILTPIAHLFTADGVMGVVVADLLAAVILICICFMAGLVARTGIGALFSKRMEQVVLRRVPGFTFLKTIAHGITGLEVESELSVALARIEDAWVLSFVVERHASGLFTVFVPSAPTPAAGSIYYLTADRLRMLNVPVSAAVACIMRLGIGSRDLLDSQQQLVAELTHNQAPREGQPT